MAATVAWTAGIPAVAAAAEAEVAPVRRVLVLHSYHAGHSWTDREAQGIESVLAHRPGRVELYVEYLDARRFPGLIARHVEDLAAKYAGLGIDVVLVSDNDALDVAIANRRRLFANVPIVFCGVNDYSDSLLRGERQITGVVEEVDVPATLELAMRFHPDVGEIVVVVGPSKTGVANRALFEKAYASLHLAIPARFVVTPTVDALRALLRAPGPSRLGFLLGQVLDGAGRALPPDVSTRLIAPDGVPLYSQWDFYLGHGIVGGMLASGFEQGRTAATLAARILEGESADRMAVVRKSPNRYMFDHDVLERFGIPERALPRGSLVVNEPRGFLAVYGRVLAVAGAIILLLSATVLVLFFSVRRARRAERALAASKEDLERANALLDANVKRLRRLLPICASCKKIRDDKGYWNRIEAYLSEHLDARFTHGMCPECMKQLGFPDAD